MTGLFILIVVAVVVIVGASSARNRNPTPRSSWILLGAVALIAIVLGYILAHRHGV